MENNEEKDSVVEEIMVKLDSEDGCRTDDEVKNIIEYKLQMGIDMEELRIERK